MERDTGRVARWALELSRAGGEDRQPGPRSLLLCVCACVCVCPLVHPCIQLRMWPASSYFRCLSVVVVCIILILLYLMQREDQCVVLCDHENKHMERDTSHLS